MRRRWLSLLLGVSMLSVLPVYTASATPAGAANIGVYHWDRQPGQISDFSEWINKSAYLAEDFLLNQNWSQLEGADRLSYWQGTPWQNKMVWAAYPFPNGQGNLKDAAAGSYNSHYYQLGVNLVNAGMDNAIIRFGHEFNGNWYDYSVFKDPDGVSAGEARFAESFRQFVTTMRSVPNQHFKFVWNPTVNIWGVDLANAYPGNNYVDEIGIDTYDQSWDANTYPYPDGATAAERLTRQQNAWTGNLYNNNWGLNMIADFADANNKPIVIPEWGIAERDDGHGGGDNAYYVEQMYNWMSSRNVIWNIYFNVPAGDGNHDLYDTVKFPEASAKFQQLWNPSGVTPVPRPANPAVTYPAGTVFVEAESGTYSQVPGTQARSYGNPWASGKQNASLFFTGAAVSFPNAPESSSLMVRYQAPPDGDIYMSVYVDNVLKASHVKLPSVDRTLQTTYRVLNIPVTVPSGSTVKFQIDSNDDQTPNGVWDAVYLDNVGFVPPSQPAGGTAHSGTWSAKGVLGSGMNWKYMVQYPVVASNTSYTASVWLKGSGQVSLRVLDASNWSTIASQTFTATNTWSQVSLPFNSGNRTQVIYELIDDTGSSGTLYMDDAYLGIGASSTNLLSNPGFESGNNNEWSGDWGSIFSIIQDTAPPSNTHSGTWSAKGVLGSGMNWKYMVQYPVVASNTSYTASVWLKGSGQVSLRVLDASNWSTIASQTFTATNTWSQVSLPFNSGNRTQVIYELIDDAGSSGTLYMDDAYLGIGASGTNLLSNPGFESGNNNEWGGDWGSIFSIVQP